MSRVRPLALLLAAAAGALVLGAADRSRVDIRLRAGGPLESLVFRGFHGGSAGERIAGGSQHSRIVVAGLSAGAPAEVVLGLGTQRGPRRARVFANEALAGEFRLEGEPAPVAFTARADERGRLALRFTGVRSDDVIVRVSSLEVRQRGPSSVPLSRWALHLLLAAALFGLAWRPRRRVLKAAAAAGLVLAILALGVAFDRARVMAVLPWLALALGLAEGWLLGSELGAAAMGGELAAARWVVLALGLKLALVLQPHFDSIDAPWHARNVWQFRTGGITASTAPGLAAAPYPPGAYALLAPFAKGTREPDVRLVRAALALFEGAAPIAVFWLVAAAGGSRAAAGAAAATAAVMPEGTLVLAKGILSNVFASTVGLAALVAVARGAPAVLTTALLALACLGHFAGGVSLLALAGAWSLLQLRRGEIDRRALLLRAAGIAAAVAIAWLAYYRAAPLAFERPGATPSYPAVLFVRWYRLGKVVQDLLLKFGLAPLVLAAYGLPRAPARLRTLLHAWLLTAAVLGAAAVLTPFPARFEYFVLPAIAIAAGLGIERLSAARRGKALVLVALAAVLALQAALGVLILQGRFEMISVILESPRWPFPVKP